jgi:thiol-disulfide isomerase/thioredoxin
MRVGILPEHRFGLALLMVFGMTLGATTSLNALTAGGVFQDETKSADDKTETAEAKETPKRPAIYDESANASQQIAAAVAKAKKENRRVLIQWGANWCGWCHLLHGTFAKNGEIRRELMYEYDVVLVDVGQGDKNLELAKKYGAKFADEGLPYLTILDADGEVVVNQETESLEKKEEGVNEHEPKAIMEFLTKHQATAPAAQQVFDAGIERAKAENKFVFLHFGAPWCGWCHRLEDWMAISANGELLKKAFVDVKIDTDRMEGGQEFLKELSKGENGGIPWVVIIDPATGDQVANSNGPEGNVGFPYTDEEIAWFGKMLESADNLLSESDRQTLVDSLKTNRDRLEAERAQAAEAARAAEDK